MAKSTTANNMLDITSLITETVETKLSTSNPMLHTTNFSLQDSMAALQIMSPNMDCCAIPDIALSRLQPPKRLTDIEFEDLNVEQVACIAVECWTRIEALLGGVNVLESTYTCLYAHNHILREMRYFCNENNKVKAQHYALYASVLALVKISNAVHEIVTQADIYEEEDFDIKVLSFDFARDVASDADVPRTILHALELLFDEEENMEAVCILTACLKAQMRFFDSCSVLSSITSSSSPVLADAEKASVCIVDGVAKLLDLHKLITTQYKKMLSKPEHTLLLENVFNVFVNRSIMGNAPVRQVRIKPRDEAIATLITILDETQLVCQVLMKGTNYIRLKRILQRISQHGPPNILTRSLLVVNLYFNDLILGQWPATDFVRGAMHDAGVPSSLTRTPYGMSFVDRVVKPAYDSLRLLCLNRGRQKECIDSVILKDWGLLQQEAKAIDYHYNEESSLEHQQNSSMRATTARFHATNWIISETLWLMEGSISLGIEADLFQVEIDAAFWYRDFLVSTQLNIMTAFRNVKEENTKKVKIMEEEQRRVVKKKKGKKSNSNFAKQSVNNSIPSAMEREDNVEYVYTSVKRTLCRGIFRFLMVLKQANFLKSDAAYQFTSRETIINKRFESFRCIDQPALLTYNDFMQGSDFSRVDREHLISAAAECFDTTKALIDQLSKSLELIQIECAPFDKSEVTVLKKVCIGNSIFLHKVGALLKDHKTKVNVEYEFVHKQFCIIKVAEATLP